MLKKTVSFILAMLLVSILSLSCLGASSGNLTVGEYEVPIDITVNGEYIYKDAKGVFGPDDEIYVPLEKFCEALGFNISYNRFTRISTLAKDGRLIRFSADKPVFVLAAFSRNYELALIDGTQYVKATLISELLEASAEWDSLMCELDLTLPGYDLPDEYTETEYNAEDIYWLSRIVTCESGSVSVDAKIMVANVIINRRASNQFPNTIKEVIFDKKFGIQFPPAHNGFIHKVKPTTNTILACKAALGGVMLVPGCKYFSYTVDNFSWVYQNCELYKVIGNQAFYK